MTRLLLTLGAGWFILSSCDAPASAQAPRFEFLGKTAVQWLEKLGSSEAPLRRNAAFALGQMGGAAEAAVGPLTALIQKDSVENVREAAAFALGEICHGGRGVTGATVGALTTALAKDPSPLVRRSAAYALGCLKSASPEIQQALGNALADPSATVRQNVAWALGHVGPTAVPALRKALVDGDALVCRDAASACGQLGKEAHAALPELLTCCLPNRDPELRKKALSVLANLVEPEDKIAVQPLTQAIADRDLEIKRNAALALSSIGGPEAAAAIPVLLEALRGGDLELKRQAAAAIKNIGKDAVAALPALRAALDDPDEELRMNAAVALGGLAETAAPAVLDLVRHLTNPKESTKVRTEAAVSLSRIGPVPDAVNSVPLLLKVLENPSENARVRERIIWALQVHHRNLSSLNAFPSLEKVLTEPRQPETRMLRYNSAFMLGMLLKNEASKTVMDVLHEFLKDKSIVLYVGTTAKTGATGTEVSGKKTEIEETGNEDGRVMAVRALDQMGVARLRARPEIVRELEFLANDPNTLANLRTKAKELVRKLGK